MDRRVAESVLSLGYRIGKRAGSLEAEWLYRSEDRDFQTVLGNSTETTTNRYRLTYRAKPWKNGQVRALYERLEANHTYGNPNGTCTTATAPGNPNPLAAMQYYVWRKARVFDPSASPETSDQWKLSATHNFGSRASLTASSRWTSQDNREEDNTDWSRDLFAADLTFWNALTPKVEWFATAALQRVKLDFPACIPLMDG